MRTTGVYILKKFQKRWQLMLFAEILLYALGAAVLVHLVFLNIILSISVFMLVGVVASLLLKPWTRNLEFISSYIDRNLETVEYSSSLLLLPQEQLTGLAQLQQQRVSAQLEEKIAGVKPETRVPLAATIAGVLILIGILIYHFNPLHSFSSAPQPAAPQETIIFHPADSISAEIAQPEIREQKVIISYPAYTGVATFFSSTMDIEALEGSRVTWEISFDTPVDSVHMESMGTRYSMEYRNGGWSRSSSLNASGFYNFRFSDSVGRAYVSNLFSIEVIRDRGPEIEIEGLKQFTSFDFDDDKRISFRTGITDDFGIADAYIIATVSKGTGESVKFREERLSFNESVQSGSKSLDLAKNIDLDQMKMEPGDELYFYVEAVDGKQPLANRTRSETYFAVIKDTVSYGYGIEGDLGVDLMPDYFRSQRQLIIDTEKLISNRNVIPTREFNSTSNNLGFDQKALRLRYGQFMGDETEGPETREMPGEDHHVDDHSGEEEDPLAAFTHDHDGSNEHNLVEPGQDHDHAHEDDGNEEQDPLSNFIHDHGDPESATLFTDSLRSKLRQTLNIMWDAELHLRLHEPEKSLPFQYRALALLQEIKNSARIYVHRIGFDPPPIKEDARLSGKIEDVSNYQKTEDIGKPKPALFMRKAILRLEELQAENSNTTEEDRKLFEQAGNELAEKAIEEPGKYLQTLQKLKWLTEERSVQKNTLLEVQRGLLKALPAPETSPAKASSFTGEIHKLLLKELEQNDQ